MKTQCDACCKRDASVFCYTQEIALCHPCDHQARQGNHTLQNHQRVSIFYPIPKHIPICDVCQETKAFIFCLEHRAVLCRTCDLSLHAKNDKFTSKHSRFVLNGARFCNDKNDGDTDLMRSSTGTSDEKHHGVNQLESESGNSASNSVNPEVLTENPPEAKGKRILDMSSDDPYGLCEKGEGAGSTFADTDLGCYLSLLSPKDY